MSAGTRVIVFLVFAILAASFVAETLLLATEFEDAEWFTLATHDSHLFLFFPTLGLVALAAFYLPSCAFVDMYWRHIKMGRTRFVLGLVVLAAAAYWVGAGLAASPYRSIWDLAPETLLADKSEPP